MIAYIFWHRPGPAGPDAAYEAGLRAFHATLAADRPAGLIATAAMRVEVPWLAGVGYEDWYLVEGWGDLGTLNDAAVDVAHRGAHDRVAGLAGAGVGAV